MRLLIISAFGLAASGCAIFDGGERTAMTGRSVAPAAEQSAAPLRAPRTAIRPAFGGGQPVALVPCSSKVAYSGDCRNVNTRHQIAGDVPSDAAGGPLAEASLEPSED
jgi:hypothetical protein